MGGGHQTSGYDGRSGDNNRTRRWVVVIRLLGMMAGQGTMTGQEEGRWPSDESKMSLVGFESMHGKLVPMGGQRAEMGGQMGCLMKVSMREREREREIFFSMYISSQATEQSLVDTEEKEKQRHS